jgi:hypothetical protein
VTEYALNATDGKGRGMTKLPLTGVGFKNFHLSFLILLLNSIRLISNFSVRI